MQDTVVTSRVDLGLLQILQFKRQEKRLHGFASSCAAPKIKKRLRVIWHHQRPLFRAATSFLKPLLSSCLVALDRLASRPLDSYSRSVSLQHPEG